MPPADEHISVQKAKLYLETSEVTDDAESVIESLIDRVDQLTQMVQEVWEICNEVCGE